MRTIITSSGLVVILAICIVIHCCIINNNMRDNEVYNSLDQATDYAIDVIDDIYAAPEFNLNKSDQYLTDIMSAYCNAINQKIGTDGEIKIQLVEADIENGTFEIIVTEEYSYKVKGLKKGTCTCDKSFRLI